MTRVRCALLALALAVPAQAGVPDGTAKGRELFNTKVKQILAKKCLDCHGGAKVKGNFNLSTREGLLKGGKHHGDRTVIPFGAASSKLLASVQKLEKPYMPPKEWLTLDEITALHRWIDQGAPYDGPLK